MYSVEYINDQFSPSVFVVVIVPPEVMLFEQEAEVKAGEEVVMACIVQSSPLEDAFWTDENGGRLTTNFKYIVSLFSYPLAIYL